MRTDEVGPAAAFGAILGIAGWFFGSDQHSLGDLIYDMAAGAILVPFLATLAD